MTGKEKCNLLRQIRKEIAKTNGIEYLTSECDYQGNDCPGTCPKCDAEVRYLESELNRRAAMGYPITLAGLSANLLQNVMTDSVNPDIIPDRERTVGILPEQLSGGFMPEPPPVLGLMAPPEPDLYKDIDVLDLPTSFVWWLRREGVDSVEQLRNMVRYASHIIRRENDSWYELAVDALMRYGVHV